MHSRPPGGIVSEIRSQATPARDELAAAMKADLLEADGRNEFIWYDNDDYAFADLDAITETLLAAGWSKPRTVKFSELGSLPIGVVIRNNEGGTIAVRESEKDWFIPGLDYEIELWELENPEGEDFTILFTPEVRDE